jgi:hypothetical protein
LHKSVARISIAACVTGLSAAPYGFAVGRLFTVYKLRLFVRFHREYGLDHGSVRYVGHLDGVFERRNTLLACKVQTSVLISAATTALFVGNAVALAAYRANVRGIFQFFFGKFVKFAVELFGIRVDERQNRLQSFDAFHLELFFEIAGHFAAASRAI